MILEVALGVALGLFIFANLRGLLALGALVALVVLLFVLAGAAIWAFYSGLQTIRSLPPMVEPGSTTSIALGIGVGLLVNVALAFAVGTVLQQRLGLAAREAEILGATFYVLFLSSAIGIPLAVEAYSETKHLAAPLLLLVLLAAWALAVQQCVRRARLAKMRTVA
jgi:hypothetical protein